MISEPLLWHFLSSLIFISVTPFSTSLPPSQQPTQPFAIEPPTSPSRRPWVPDLQPPSLKSFTLHRPLPFASPLQTLLQLRFWRYHRDCLAPIYKIVKASTPSETARASHTCWRHPRQPFPVPLLMSPACVSCWRHPLTLGIWPFTSRLTVDFDRALTLTVDFSPGLTFSVKVLLI